MEMEYLSKNIAGNEQWESSFLGQLLEYNIWDKDEFWRLHAEITRYSIEIADRDWLPRDIAAEISRIIQLVMQIYAAHMDPNDLCNIENMAEDELYNFIEQQGTDHGLLNWSIEKPWSVPYYFVRLQGRSGYMAFSPLN